jgi:hypothetical protein
LRDQTVQLGSRPARLHEERMNVRERLDAALDCVLEAFGRVGLRKMHGGLHGRQHVLGSMLGLAGENGDLRLALFARRDVAGNFRCADDFALGILDGRDGQRNLDRTAVLASANGFIMLDALATPDTVDDRGFLFLAIGGIRIVIGLPMTSSAA